MCVKDQAALPVHPIFFSERLIPQEILLLAGTFMHNDKLLMAGARTGPSV